MKNIVLIDFTIESMHALDYAIGFCKATRSDLELINVSTKDKWRENMDRLEHLKTEKETDSFKLEIHEMVGDVESSIPDYINFSNDIGFVFLGTHDKKFLDRIFQSRSMKLMNDTKAHFIFIPQNLREFKEITRVSIPVTRSAHSLQSLRIANFLANFMKFQITFFSYNSADKEEASILNKRMRMALEVADHPNIDCSSKIRGNSESDLREHLEEYASNDHTDLVIFNNTSASGDKFNFTTKGFIEYIIRNKSGIPVIAVKDSVTEVFDTTFHTTGG
ncbi:MAG: universal stress protein [Crocinitomicaceae bacterium]